MKTKRCSKCKRELPLSEFSKNRTRKGGLRDQCRECCKEYRKKRHQTIEGYLQCRFSGAVQRCNNPNDPGYKNYGGRGIEVRCTFQQFFHHITTTLGYNTWDKINGAVVDRIDTTGHYEISNLRIVTQGQNCMNSHKQRTRYGRLPSSRFKGVCWAKRDGRWRVQIMANRKRHCLGYFTDEVVAAEAYDEASLKYHGEFGATNESLGLFE